MAHDRSADAAEHVPSSRTRSGPGRKRAIPDDFITALEAFQHQLAVDTKPADQLKIEGLADFYDELEGIVEHSCAANKRPKLPRKFIEVVNTKILLPLDKIVFRLPVTNAQKWTTFSIGSASEHAQRHLIKRHCLSSAKSARTSCDAALDGIAAC